MQTGDFCKLPLAPPGSSASSSDVSHPIVADGRSLSADVADWNPFGEPPFSQMTEDHIFGAEFDKIRKGSQSSKFMAQKLRTLICEIFKF